MSLSWNALEPRRPEPGEILIWAVDLDLDEAGIAGRYAMLTPREQAWAGQLKLERVRRRFITTRGGLRVLLGQMLGRAPQDIEFEYGPKGKPSVKPVKPSRRSSRSRRSRRDKAGRLDNPRDLDGPDTPSIEFNITDSTGMALMAFALDSPIGIDLEAQKPLPRSRALAMRYLPDAERERLEDLDDEAHAAAFLRLWTMKEAYLKGLGLGLPGGLASFAVDLDKRFGRADLGDAPVLDAGRFRARSVEDYARGPEEIGAPWFVREIPCAEGFVATLSFVGQLSRLKAGRHALRNRLGLN